MTFEEEAYALFGEYGKDIKAIRDDSTLQIFTLVLKDPYSNQIRITNVGHIQIGKFYIINYNFNGNKLWCPILTIPPVPNKTEHGFIEMQLKLINNKNILYAINLDYLPTRYKISFIDAVTKFNSNIYEQNKNRIDSGKNVSDESNFKLNWVYTWLKTNGKKNYAITAYDVSKIESVYEVSSTILDRFVFLDTYYINNRIMYETLANIQNKELKEKFSKKIERFEEILKMYENDVETFYRVLRNFEKNLKLIEEL